MRFRALKTFWDATLQSNYCEGLTYTVRRGNLRLLEEVNKWVSEGKVEISGDPRTVEGSDAPAPIKSRWEKFLDVWR